MSKKKCHCGYLCKHVLGRAPNPEDAAEYMNEYWNWCVLDGCRQIIKSGRLYIKGKYNDQYTYVIQQPVNYRTLISYGFASRSRLILLNGYLVMFKLKDEKTMYYKQYGRLSLLDVYVCSGYYAAKILPEEEYNANSPAIAKIFADGLETKDVDDDTIFMLKHRYQAAVADENLDSVEIPQLRKEFGQLICRARSRLERDAWCWAINCEIEKLVRRTGDRERRARERGMPI